MIIVESKDENSEEILEASLLCLLWIVLRERNRAVFEDVLSPKDEEFLGIHSLVLG